MNFELKVYPDRAAQAESAAKLMGELMQNAIARKGAASIALSGGTTPAPMFRSLAALDLPWEHVSITLTDERWVPVTSDRSNHRLLNDTLLAGFADASRFVPLYAEDEAPDTGLAATNAALQDVILPLDIAVLGMGADMHTASLFPDATGLDAALAEDAPAAVAIVAPGADEPRVTLSAPVLRSAERHLFIHGQEKRAALHRAVDIADPVIAPVCAILDGATVHYAD